MLAQSLTTDCPKVTHPTEWPEWGQSRLSGYGRFDRESGFGSAQSQITLNVPEFRCGVPAEPVEE